MRVDCKMTTPSNRNTSQTIISRPEKKPIGDELHTSSTLNIEISKKFKNYNNEYHLPLERDTAPPSCSRAFLCVFSVTVYPHPYIQYLLYKYDGDDGLLTFPIVAKDHKGGDALLNLSNSLYAKCCGLDSSIASSLGYIQKGDDVYIFYEYQVRIPLQTLPSSHRLWWALLDEICNHKKLLTFPVDSTVYKLFYENIELTRVMNSNDEVVPAPKVAYYGANSTTLAYAAAIGVQQSDPRASFGPFYYFSTFNRSVRFSIWDYARSSTQIGTKKQNLNIPGKTPGKHDSGGVVRHAVFNGGPFETFVPLGRKSEEKDESESARKRRERPGVEILSKIDREKITKLTDHDATWAASWSSVISGILRGEDGQNLNWIGVPEINQSNDPIIVVRDFSQQTALSVHYVNDDKSKDGWQNNVVYTIS